MSSSDSDDDFYNNIIKKRDKILRTYKADESKTNLDIDDSIQIDDLDNDNIIDTTDLKTKTTRKTRRKASEKGKTSKRGRKTVQTESEISDSSCVEVIDISEVTKGGNRRRSSRLAKNDPVSDSVSIIDVVFAKDSTRGKKTIRGRGRGQKTTPRGRSKTRRRRDQRVEQTPVIPTYSVGNTEEYDDELKHVPLFSSKQKNNVVVLNDTDIEENEELSVKVYWRCVDIFKFNIRKYQKLTEIFKFFADKEKVPLDNLLFTYDDKVLRPDHTPDSIDYNIAKFIDGGIVYQNKISTVPSKTIKGSGLKIKFQCTKSKKPVEIYIEKDDKLLLAMTKCAEHLELPLNKLKFEFDGDTITGSETLQDLDMEGEECIDVKIIN